MKQPAELKVDLIGTIWIKTENSIKKCELCQKAKIFRKNVSSPLLLQLGMNRQSLHKPIYIVTF